MKEFLAQIHRPENEALIPTLDPNFAIKSLIGMQQNTVKASKSQINNAELLMKQRRRRAYPRPKYHLQHQKIQKLHLLLENSLAITPKYEST